MEGFTPHERDLTGNDGGAHARLAQGLIDAAAYIKAHPELPIPRSAEIHFCIPAATDQAGEEEAYRIAGILGAKVTGDDSAETALAFGPDVSYRAVYITRDRVAAWKALMASKAEAA